MIVILHKMPSSCKTYFQPKKDVKSRITEKGKNWQEKA